MEEQKEYKPWQFKPGNPGKPKGAKNKVSPEVKYRVESILEMLDDDIQELINSMSDKEKIRMWFDLQEYIRPKMNRTAVEIEKEEEITEIRFVFKPEAQDEEGCEDK
ncbi:MAG: hypothetical protein IH595_11695 [Bacteroidales bacterium]|nr:hypothetical protein [Bacteroidales bacterium]